MKNKILFLGAVISACVLSSSCAGNQMNADPRNPNLPNGGRKCNSMNGTCTNPIESVNSNSNNNGNGNSYNGRGYGYSSGNSNNDAQGAKLLKTESIETFKGTVTTVNRERQPDGKLFIQIILDTNEGEKTVMVGPANYVDQSKVKLQVGDKVTVKGFRIGANGNEVINAQEIDKSGNKIQLLNEQRQPLWQQYGYNNNRSNGYGYKTRSNGYGGRNY